MRKHTAETASGERIMRALNDIGRCATCPTVCGVEMKPVQERNDARRDGDCRDLRRGGVSERMHGPANQGYTTFHEGYAVCGRDEVATAYGVFDRTVTWRQVGRQLLRPEVWRSAGRDFLRFAGEHALQAFAVTGAMRRGDWAAVESYAVGSYVLPAEHVAPPAADAIGRPIV